MPVLVFIVFSLWNVLIAVVGWVFMASASLGFWTWLEHNPCQKAFSAGDRGPGLWKQPSNRIRIGAVPNGIHQLFQWEIGYVGQYGSDFRKNADGMLGKDAGVNGIGAG
jgi:hypothetical protein